MFRPTFFPSGCTGTVTLTVLVLLMLPTVTARHTPIPGNTDTTSTLKEMEALAACGASCSEQLLVWPPSDHQCLAHEECKACWLLCHDIYTFGPVWRSLCFDNSCGHGCRTACSFNTTGKHIGAPVKEDPWGFLSVPHTHVVDNQTLDITWTPPTPHPPSRKVSPRRRAFIVYVLLFRDSTSSQWKRITSTLNRWALVYGAYERPSAPSFLLLASSSSGTLARAHPPYPTQPPVTPHPVTRHRNGHSLNELPQDGSQHRQPDSQPQGQPHSHNQAQAGHHQPHSHNQAQGHHQPHSHNQPQGHHQPHSHNQAQGHHQPHSHNQAQGHHQPHSHNQPQGHHQPHSHNQPQGHHQPHGQNQLHSHNQPPSQGPSHQKQPSGRPTEVAWGGPVHTSQHARRPLQHHEADLRKSHHKATHGQTPNQIIDSVSTTRFATLNTSERPNHVQGPSAVINLHVTKDGHVELAIHCRYTHERPGGAVYAVTWGRHSCNVNPHMKRCLLQEQTESAKFRSNDSKESRVVLTRLTFNSKYWLEVGLGGHGPQVFKFVTPACHRVDATFTHCSDGRDNQQTSTSPNSGKRNDHRSLTRSTGSLAKPTNVEFRTDPENSIPGCRKGLEKNKSSTAVVALSVCSGIGIGAILTVILICIIRQPCNTPKNYDPVSDGEQFSPLAQRVLGQIGSPYTYPDIDDEDTSSHAIVPVAESTPATLDHPAHNDTNSPNIIKESTKQTMPLALHYYYLMADANDVSSDSQSSDSGNEDAFTRLSDREDSSSDTSAFSISDRSFTGQP